VTTHGTTTVIIPVFNGEKYIAAALESVRAQTRPVEEVIVIDDGSTDGTVEIVESFPEVTLLRQLNQGPSVARNWGIKQARGDYLAMLDADDLWPPNRQEIIAGMLDAEPSLGIVMGTQKLLVEPGAALPYWVPEGDLETIDPEQLPRPTGAFVARRSVYGVVGLYEEAMHHAEDTDWFLRSRDLGIVWAMIPDVVLIRRIHGANLTYDTAAQHRALFEVLQRRMARRRAT
jgi:glycosyltransferase involved in cell wall biosynthesis